VGYTPLHAAVRDGNRETAELLLKYGADMTIADNNNDTPLKTAIYYGFLDLAKALVDKGARLDIFTASGMGMVEKVREFLDKGVDYKAEQRDYVSRQRPESLLIVTSSSDPLPRMPGSYLGSYAVTPLHWAAIGGNVEVARLLVSHGESVNAKDSRGMTPLFWALDRGRQQVAEFLVKQGADVNATNRFGGTPLLIAARSPRPPEMIKFLIEAGADANARDRAGENGLHKLAWSGDYSRNIKIAQWLLDAGADITARNKDGKTPLDLLVMLGGSQTGDLVKLYQKYSEKTAPGH